MNIFLHRSIRTAFENSATALELVKWNTPQINAKCAFLFKIFFFSQFLSHLNWIFFAFTLPSEAIDLFACAPAWKLDWLYACLRSLHEVTAWVTDCLSVCCRLVHASLRFFGISNSHLQFFAVCCVCYFNASGWW